MSLNDRRFTGAAGIVFVAASMLAAFAPGSPPMFDDPIEKITRFFVDNDSQIVAAAFVSFLALAVFLIFFTGLWRYLRERAGQGFDVTTLFFAAAIALVGTIAAGTAANAVPAWQSEQIGAPSQDTVRLMFDVSNMAFVLAGVFAALLLGAASVAILRDRSLPAWLGVLGGLAAASNVVSALGIASHDLLKASVWDGFLPFDAWVLLVSLVLLVGREDLSAPAR